MPTAIGNVVKLLKPGGTLLFRDYAAEDLAAARFEAKGNPAGFHLLTAFTEAKGEKKLGENFYVRGDGTQAYYFSEGALKNSLWDLAALHSGAAQALQ
jgi:methyltransferase-like protein 6